MGLYYPPGSQEQDSSGFALAGAKLYFYEVGTSTPKDTYQDKALSTAHTNPVVADAAGRFAAIYTDGAYKITLTDSNDNVIDTNDNISFGADAVFAQTESITTTTAIDATYQNNHIRVTGTTTLNLLDIASAGVGFVFSVINDGSGDVTIDPNASEQINDALTLVLKPGDAAIVISGTSEWSAMVARANLISDTTPQLGGALDTNGNIVKWSKGADIASASELTLGTDGNYFDVTGTTTITSIATTGTIGTVIKLHFDGILTLTHDATNLILPSGANITTAAGDEAEFIEYASGDFRCTNYTKASGLPVVEPTFLQNYISGLMLSNDMDTDHDINVTAGIAADSTNAQYLTLSSEITKQIDASWAAGNDAGGLSSSLTVANNTWYHVFLIVVAGSVDVGFDTSITAANLVTDHSATAYRRIGSVFTDGSANIRNFVHNGDEFYWDTPYLDHSATGSTTASSITMSTPLGVKTKAYVSMSLSANGVYSYVSSLDNTDQAPSTTVSPLKTIGNSTGANNSSNTGVWTNTSSQIRLRSSGTGATVYMVTLGYLDPRG